jgi:hypothetical protein
LACVDMFVRVRSRSDGQTLRDPVHGFNTLYRGGIPVSAFACGKEERSNPTQPRCRIRQPATLSRGWLPYAVFDPATGKGTRQQPGRVVCRVHLGTASIQPQRTLPHPDLLRRAGAFDSKGWTCLTLSTNQNTLAPRFSPDPDGKAVATGCHLTRFSWQPRDLQRHCRIPDETG